MITLLSNSIIFLSDSFRLQGNVSTPFYTTKGYLGIWFGNTSALLAFPPNHITRQKKKTYAIASVKVK